MKHIVEIKYTNPSHEHVSLRRRVETVNRVVEAQSADEALNRAANQQRSLGFRIQSANVVEQKVEEPTTEVLSEDVELEEGKIAKALAVGAMSLASMGAKAHTDTTKSVAQLAKERPALAQRLHDIGAAGQVPASDKRAAELQRKQDQEMPASERRAKELKKEEAEQVDEANMRFDPEAAARPKSSDVKNFLNRGKNARAGAASKKYIRRMTKLGGLGPNQTKKDTEAHMKAHFEEVEISEASKEGKSVMYGMRASMKAMDLRHGIDSDKRDSGYKMSPAVRAAQAKSDALSKVEKPVQAGTLAALKRREMKKEEVESVDEGVISAVKNAQAKWKTAHRAVYGKDPSLKSMTVGAIARLAGAKASTARAVGAAVGGKSVSAQQQAAAKARAGKVGVAKMRNEEKHEGDDVNANVKGKKAAEKMTKKAAEVRKAKIQGSVNKINMEPTIDLNKKAEK
jgi:hypothetical protein